MVQVETYVYKTLFDTHKHAYIYFYIEGEESDSTTTTPTGPQNEAVSRHLDIW